MFAQEKLFNNPCFSISIFMRASLIQYNSRDMVLSRASVAYFIGSAFNGCVKNVFSIPSSLYSLISIVVGLIIVYYLVKGYLVLGHKSKKLFWKSYFLFFIVYLFSALLITLHDDPIDQMVMGTAFLTFAWWVPCGVMACSVEDKNTLYSVWVKASYVISVLSLLLFFFHRDDEIIAESGTAQYNMFFGFTMILPLLIQMNEFQRTKRLILLPLILVELIAILLFANRGVILSVVFFCFYKFGFESNSVIKRTISIIIMASTAIVLMSSIGTIAEAALRLMVPFDLQSRSLEAIANGTLSDSGGRDEIWKVCYGMIKERPIFGWGLGGEYYHIAKEAYGTTIGVTAEAYHPHNGLLQNIVCFGIFGGIIISLIILHPLFHLNRTKDIATHDLLVIFASASIIPMCVSSAHFFTRPAAAIYLYLFYFSYYWVNKKHRNNHDEYKKDLG